MPDARRREKQTIEDSETDANVMSQLAEVITQNVLERDVSHVESFELYAHQLRSQLYSDGEVFKLRFSQGYLILLAELEKEPII